MPSEASLNYSLLILRYNTKYHTYGAVDWDRTSDLLVTNELLYQLSYNGNKGIISHSSCFSWHIPL